MTTCDPGASDVLTQGLTCKPRAAAFLATSPAPSMTDGFEVLVQDVIEAMTTAPSSSSKSCPLMVPLAGLLLRLRSACSALSASLNMVFEALNGIRSWGRLGPARLGTTVDMSSSTTLVYSASG